MWITAWDDVGEASQAAEAARRVIASLPPDVRERHHAAVFGRGMLILRGLPPALHAPITTAFRVVAAAMPSEPPRSPGARPDATTRAP